MKKLIISTFALFSAFFSFGQDEELVDIFNNITLEKRYEIDGDNIVVSKVIENVSGTKNEIYSRLKANFVRTYNDNRLELLTDDKEIGLIIYKGCYINIVKYRASMVGLSSPYTVRIDIKDGKVRIICNTDIMVAHDEAKYQSGFDYKIIDAVPFTEKRKIYVPRTTSIKGFIKLIDLMENSIKSIEFILMEGGALNSEKEDW